MDPKATARRAGEFPQLIVGIKTAHYAGPEWIAVERALEAGKLAKIPVMVDFGTFRPERPFPELVLQKLRPGDMYTHAYVGHVPLLDEDNQVRRYLWEARKRGVLFDVGHGAGSFVFRQAAPAVAQGWTPDSISTDLHSLTCEGPAYDMPTVMTRMLYLGMSLEDVIRCSTISAAAAIGWDGRIGSLGLGREADITVLALEDVTMELEDCNAQMRSIRQQIVPHAVWRSGDPGEITAPKHFPNVENIASAKKRAARLVIHDEPL